MEDPTFEYLRLIGELSALRTDTLQKWLGWGRVDGDVLSYKNTRKHRDRWKAQGLVEVELLAGHAWVRLTKDGLGYAQLPYKVEKWPHNLTHHYAVTDLAARLQCRYREVLRDWRGDRSFRGVQERHTYYPDLFPERLIGDDWQRVVIEVQLSRMSVDRLLSKILYLKQTFDLVYYYVTPESAPSVMSARDQLRAVYSLDFGIYELATLEVCP